VVAKKDLLDAIRDASGDGVGIAGGSAKRVCVRQPEGGGELAGAAVVEKIKGAAETTPSAEQLSALKLRGCGIASPYRRTHA
jgi:hypothetical protein